MKKNIKLSGILGLLLAVGSMNTHALLNTNSIGDDGNLNTVGNAGAKKNYNRSTKDNQLIFDIINQSSSSIMRVVIVDDKNKLLYSGKFNCNLNKKCNLNLGKITWSDSAYLKFYGSNNNLVSAYQLLGKQSGVNYIMINDEWLGIYIFNHLKQTSGKSALVLNQELIQFFRNYSSPDNTSDILEELGLYFVAQKGGLDEGKFYKNFLTKLSQTSVLSGTNVVRSSNNLKASKKKLNLNSGIVTAETGNKCQGSETAQSIFSYMSTTIGMIPVVGDVVGGFFDIGSQIISDACPSQSEIKLTEISNQIALIDSKIVTLGYNVDELASKLNMSAANEAIKKLSGNYRTIVNQYINDYVSFASSQTMSDYVKKNGGLRKSWLDAANVKDLVNSTSDQLSKFEGLLSNLDIKDLKTSLDAWCSINPNNITGDVIANRIQCDIVVNKAITTVVSSSLQIRPMLKDEINTIVEAKKSGNIDDAWLHQNINQNFVYLPDGESSNISVPWEQASAKVDEIIDKKVKYLSDILLGVDKNQLYKPLDGFPDELSKSMIADDCSSLSADGKTLMPAILEWYAKTPNDKPYLVTKCKNGNESAVKSKYYYLKRGTKEVDAKVVNVMGVLVTDRFFHGGGANNYGDSGAFNWANYSHLVTAPASHTTWNGNDYGIQKTVSIDFDDRNATAYLHTPINLSVATVGFQPASVNKTYLAPSSYTEDFKRNNKNYKREIFTATAAGSYLSYKLKYDGADYWQIADGEYFSFMRYAPEVGYAKVWAMRSKIVKSGGDFILFATPQCATNDCDAVDTGRTLDKIEFKEDNMAIQWVKSDSGIYSMTVNDKPSF